jgi:uncharacterized protein (DUF1697 family)
MTTCISILRGINVSGQKKILMNDLVRLYQKLGFIGIRTYIQSGNVIFGCPESIALSKVPGLIRDAIFRENNFDVPVIMRTSEEMNETVRNNPFLKDKSINPEKLHITFLSGLPGKEKLAVLEKIDHSPDKFIVRGKEVYLHCPVSYGETKLSNSFFEKSLGVTATTRNWKTVNKLAEMAGGNE